MKASEVLARSLVDQGVDTVFGVLGDANLFMGHHLIRDLGVTYVGATHEAIAVSMALGFARSSGRLGVATVTHGPGMTNTITALVDGVRSRTPMLLVAGDTPADELDHPQQIDQAALVATTGAGWAPVWSASTLAADLAKAIRRAWAEHRPIVLNVPVDISRQEADYTPVPAAGRFDLSVGADPDALDRAVGLLASANRPLILAGRGAVLSGARDDIVALGNELGAPLCTTVLGSGYFGGEEFNLGIHGTLAHDAALDAIGQADCVLVLGAALNRHTTDRGALLRDKRVVQVDIDPAQIGVRVDVDVAVVGDVRRVVQDMTEMLRSVDHQPSAFRSPDLERKLMDEPAADDLSTDTHLDPRTALRQLDRIIPSDRTVAVDTGRFMRQALTMPVPEPTALVTSHAFGSIGLGMGNAVGAAVAKPDRPTVLLTGDGGFMMGGIAELHTAVEHQLDLIVVVFNDGSYGAEHIQLFRLGIDPSVSQHEWPDFCTVAEAMGYDTVRVENVAGFDIAEKHIAQRQPGTPLLIDVAIDPMVASQLQL
ncbi:MAG: thiamine pyrophosphate-binding protein [Acidimicrobiales bacterium]|nr:thiamine pyrophosphate-binding protein [Acidimicrobiales bacterium]